MAGISSPSREIVAVRCHDITVSLNGAQAGEFDRLLLVGMAVQLALHLRGVATAVPYDLLRQVGLYLLHIPSTSFERVVELLAEVEFLKLDRRGGTIKAVVPTVPYYEDLFSGIGEIVSDRPLSEPEQLAIAVLDRLSRSPTTLQTLYGCGAEKRLLERVLKVGMEGGYFIGKRARGRDMMLSPVYFPEHGEAFADLAAGAGSGIVARVISILAKNQGWPLKLIRETGRIGEIPLSPDEIGVITELAKEGFSPPPMIRTKHSGANYFIFGPKPGLPNLPPQKRHIYEAAMALLAAVRQGQLLAKKYRIRMPQSLLQALKERKWLRANTEALEQYKQLVVLRLGRLVPTGGSNWYRFELIETPENLEAVDMALLLARGAQLPLAANEEIAIALQKGQEYVESLVSRQTLVKEAPVSIDPQVRERIDNLFFTGVP